ncbi:MAG: hypothetical protein AB1798_22835, partial [Spirochaetota bacterium]
KGPCRELERSCGGGGISGQRGPPDKPCRRGDKARCSSRALRSCAGRAEAGWIREGRSRGREQGRHREGV